MKTKSLMAVPASILLFLALTACASNPTNAQIGTGVGAIGGGLLGNAVTGGSTLGTVGGAAAGALIGNEVGKKR